MSERLALMQLQIELRASPDSAGARWRPGAGELGFGNTLLENRIPSSVSQARTGEQFFDALHELSAPAAPANKPRPGEVAPIEKLDLLIRLSQRKMGRTDDERLLMVAIAKTLLARAVRNDDKRLTELIQAIGKVPKDRQVIRMPVLGADMGVVPIEGRRPPWVAPKLKTVTEVLRLKTLAPGSSYVPGLADHPVVVVDVCIYKAMVGNQAEFPVHLRTTISYGPKKAVADFKDLFDPERWPDFNSFWAEMAKVTPPLQAGANVPINTPPPKQTPEEAAATRANPYIKHVESIQWHSVGTFHEQVGFDNGQNDGGPNALAGGNNPQGKRDLFPDTFLYFSRANGTTKQDLLTYTLLGRLPPLRVDDGCIEVRKTAKGVDVITTKSLYVDGQGARTELSGILAYMAAYSGWGANTLVLVSNAAKK